ncbi:PIN domain-like protein, partial [Gymnopus androsaceus JB14]
LVQLFTFLSQLSNAPAHCTFVFDGKDRPTVKRGIKVVHRKPLLYQKSQELVKAFGFKIHNAKGDADAELAVMNQLGVVDAILTRDSDIFPLGAQCVLKVVPEACTDAKLAVNVYYADVIEQDLKLNQGGLILYSLLVGNDFDKGIEGFGTVTALAVAQCGLGNTLVTDCKHIDPSQYSGYFRNLKEKISVEVADNTHGLLRTRESASARRLLDSGFPLPSALNWFLNPPTSWSDRDSASTLDINISFPRAHHIPDITQFCIKHIGCSSEQTLKRCHQKLW